MRQVTKIERGVCGTRRLYVCYSARFKRENRIALEIFDGETLQKIVSKIKGSREHAIKKDIKRTFIG